jgi:hypothetical protein
MHYIRLLRPPAVEGRDSQKILKLVLTVTTDLGDAYLQPPAPLHLEVSVHSAQVDDKTGEIASVHDKVATAKRHGLVWKDGMRVLKVDYSLPGEAWLTAGARSQEQQITISPINPRLCALAARDVVDGHSGRIMPVKASLTPSDGEADFTCIRQLQLSSRGNIAELELEEDLGDSIARHVWDGGLAAVSFLSELCLSRNMGTGMHPSLSLTRTILQHSNTPKILELGSGVGTLGLGLAIILQLDQKNEHRRAQVLLTDVAEAEPRAAANIRRWREASAKRVDANPGREVSLDYEVLDWEDGRQGRFGPETAAEPWDLIVLSDCTYNTDSIPALVETLSSLSRHLGLLTERKTRVLLATKPRHDSETLAFELLAAAHWRILESTYIPLPMIGAEDQEVHIYLYEHDPPH